MTSALCSATILGLHERSSASSAVNLTGLVSGRVDEDLVDAERVDDLGHVDGLQVVQSPVLLPSADVSVDHPGRDAGDLHSLAYLQDLGEERVALPRREELRVLDAELGELLEPAGVDRDSGDRERAEDAAAASFVDAADKHACAGVHLSKT